MGKVTSFFDCKIVRGGKLIKEDLWVRNGKIIDPSDVSYKSDQAIDCRGCYITPGFIDLKLNGALGVSFSNPESLTEESVKKVRAYLPHTGVTLFCPTIITSPKEVYPKALALLGQCSADPHDGAGIAGVHLDGPFLTVPGAHDKSLLEPVVIDKIISDGTGMLDEHDDQQAEEAAVVKLASVYGNDLDDVAIVTMAPDVKGASSAIQVLSRWGVRVSLGHSAADINESEMAVQSGATLISHIFNAMPSFHHRDPGLVGLIASDVWDSNRMKFTIIADHYHVHKAALRMAYRMAPESLVLITDGTAPMGLPPARYKIDGIDVEVHEEHGKSNCKRVESGVLFGSVCPLHRAVKNLHKIARCSLAYAFDSASRRPAEALGLYPKKGSLEFGADADFVIVTSEELNLAATFIAGKKVADNRLIDLSIVSTTLRQKPDFYAPKSSSKVPINKSFDQSPSP